MSHKGKIFLKGWGSSKMGPEIREQLSNCGTQISNPLKAPWRQDPASLPGIKKKKHGIEIQGTLEFFMGAQSGKYLNISIFNTFKPLDFFSKLHFQGISGINKRILMMKAQQKLSIVITPQILMFSVFHWKAEQEWPNLWIKGSQWLGV